MKLRLTLGSITGVLVGAAGLVIQYSDLLTQVSPKVGGTLVVIAGGILAISKNLFSGNTKHIDPADKKELGPIVLQKTLVK